MSLDLECRLFDLKEDALTSPLSALTSKFQTIHKTQDQDGLKTLPLNGLTSKKRIYLKFL
jgi:hypothetical protein